MQPRNPIEAVTHADPYPYYERLLEDPPLQFHDGLRVWIASQAAAVSAVLACPDCRARPSDEAVPASIAGLPAGEIFGHLVRMNDGTKHDRPKLALERALASMNSAQLEMRCSRIARLNVPSLAGTQDLSDWMFDTPLTVVADLLGFAEDEQAIVAGWTREFVACFSPLSTAEQLAAASAAASLLQSRMLSLLRSTPPPSASLLARVCAEAEAVGWSDSTAIIANLVGVLTQTCEATAGLIGNAIVMLAVQPRLIHEVQGMADGWSQLVHETSRYESPVQNTRRFIAERTCIAGIDLEHNSAVLLVLAAANRDPNANTQAGEFKLHRPDRCVFTFSRGAHACPGEALARSIAATALAVLFESRRTDWLRSLTWNWRPSANIRFPVFH